MSATWERGTGRTTGQMRAAPFGAVYVWPVARSVGYAVELARLLNRPDLAVTALGIAEPRNLRGVSAEIVMDHAAWDHMKPDEFRDWERLLRDRSLRASMAPRPLRDLLAVRPIPELPPEAGAAYDPVRDVLRMYGVSYSLVLFKLFGEGKGGLAPGARVEVVERTDGAVTLRTLAPFRDGTPELPPGPDAGMVDALRAVLLFYADPPWTEDKMTEWLRLTGSWDVTTRALCDKARAALGDTAP